MPEQFKCEVLIGVHIADHRHTSPVNGNNFERSLVQSREAEFRKRYEMEIGRKLTLHEIRFDTLSYFRMIDGYHHRYFIIWNVGGYIDSGA